MANGDQVSLKSRALDWLFQQGVSTVLLAAILGLLAWGGKYMLEHAIPDHLRSIQEGYEHNASNLKDVMDAHIKHSDRERALLIELLREDKKAPTTAGG